MFSKVAGALSPRVISRSLPVIQRQSRRFVDNSVFNVVCQSKVGRIGARILTIQVLGQCEMNVRRMFKVAIPALVADGVLRKPHQAPVEERPHRYWLLDLLLGDEDAKQLVWNSEGATFENIVRLNQMHGPVGLRMQAMLSSEQGGKEYENYHCALLLGVLERGGEIIGVLLDGNDKQRNAAMSAIRDHMDRHGDTRELFELTPENLDQITEERCAHSDSKLDVRQLGLRLVDLKGLVKASEKTMEHRLTCISPDSPVGPPLPNAVFCDEQAEVAEPLLPQEVRDALIALIDEDPTRVERFE